MKMKLLLLSAFAVAVLGWGNTIPDFNIPIVTPTLPVGDQTEAPVDYACSCGDTCELSTGGGLPDFDFPSVGFRRRMWGAVTDVFDDIGDAVEDVVDDVVDTVVPTDAPKKVGYCNKQGMCVENAPICEEPTNPPTPKADPCANAKCGDKCGKGRRRLWGNSFDFSDIVIPDFDIDFPTLEPIDDDDKDEPMAKYCNANLECETGYPVCEPEEHICGPVCMIYCPFGNVTDEYGCPTCSCKDDPNDGKCLDVFCFAPCPYGNYPDENGCDTCNCKPDPNEPVCPPVCDIWCEFGNVQDENGCDTCECKKDDCNGQYAACDQPPMPCEGAEWVTDESDPCVQGCGWWDESTCKEQCPNGIMMCSIAPPPCDDATFIPDDSDPCVQGCGSWDESTCECPQGIMMCGMSKPPCEGATYVPNNSDPCVQGCGTWDDSTCAPMTPEDNCSGYTAKKKCEKAFDDNWCIWKKNACKQADADTAAEYNSCPAKSKKKSCLIAGHCDYSKAFGCYDTTGLTTFEDYEAMCYDVSAKKCTKEKDFCKVDPANETCVAISDELDYSCSDISNKKYCKKADKGCFYDKKSKSCMDK